MTDAWIIELSACAREGSNKYLIWYEDEQGKNCVYTRGNKIACFCNESAAKDAISRLDLCYKDTESYDLGRLIDWLCAGSSCQAASGDFLNSACDFLLNFWNLFDDICYSLCSEFEAVSTELSQSCYNKLFLGTDAASVAQCECGNAPVFTQQELEYIRTLMRRGIVFLQNNTECLE